MSSITAVEILSIALIVLWNAYFVAAEYAFVTVRRTRLRELAEGGSRRARLVLDIVEKPTIFIAAMQVGVTLSSLALGAVGEPAFSKLVQSLFGNHLPSAVSAGLADTLSVIIAFALISTLHVVLGEIVPKTFALGSAERVALWTAPGVQAFIRICYPFILVLQRLARLVNRLLGLKEPTGTALVHSEDELKMLVSASMQQGVLEESEQEMLHKVFDFSETVVEDVMVPRPDIVALPVSLSAKDAMALVLKQPYTRYPVYGEDLDDVVGTLHIRRLYDALQNGHAEAADLHELVRPAHIVPETKRLGPLLGEFRRMSTHMAVVVDEYGSTAGIVTLEDLLEEIVGEIDDEYDLPDVAILRLGRDRIRIAGAFPVEDFNERFAMALSEEDYVTVGGIVFGELGRAPQVGDKVEIGRAAFTVREIDGLRITTVDVEFKPVEVEPDDDEDDD